MCKNELQLELLVLWLFNAGTDFKRSRSQLDKLSRPVILCTMNHPNSFILLLKFDCESLIKPFRHASKLNSGCTKQILWLQNISLNVGEPSSFTTVIYSSSKK